MSELLTVAQVAALLQISPDTVMRRFARVKGVVDIGTSETPKRRRYRVLRIPRTVVERWVLDTAGVLPLTYRHQERDRAIPNQNHRRTKMILSVILRPSPISVDRMRVERSNGLHDEPER